MLRGRIFGFLSVIEKDTNKNSSWVCRCICGKTTSVRKHQLTSGGTKSCGCKRYELVAKTRNSKGYSSSEEFKATYKSWRSMIERCYDIKHHAYKEYGGSGIKVCEEWNSKSSGTFDNFLEDMGKRPENTSLNRIKGSKIYSKETCEWATRSIQGYDQKRRITNKSGRTGVYWSNRENKWLASITFNYKEIYLGSFIIFEEAVKAREEAELKYFGFIKE